MVLLVLVGDGIRRENAEMGARLASVSGGVTITGGAGGYPRGAAAKAALAEGDVVATVQNGNAVILMADGSSLQLEPNSQVEIRRLGYSRGGVRDRSVMLRAGAVTVNLAEHYGKRSQMYVCTPTAVAVGTAGSGFRVFFEPSQRITFLQTADGQLQLRTPAGTLDASDGRMAQATGYELRGVQDLPLESVSVLRKQLAGLSVHARPPGFIAGIESGLNAGLDGGLQTLGFAPGTWNYDHADWVRRATCTRMLRDLSAQCADDMEGTPAFLNAVTLEELKQSGPERDRILSAFAGKMVERYEKQGKDGCVIRVRARDRGRTLYESSPNGIHEIKE